MMKKLLIYIVAGIMVAASCTYAIDKKTARKVKPADVENIDSLKLRKNKPADARIPSRESDTDSKNYNDFIDENNNGIDDRVENRRKAKVPSPEPPDKKSSDSTDRKNSEN